MPERSDPAPGRIAVAAIVVFFIHALNYLYFFVDDEAIPYVYAQNLLKGKGLSYNAIEGRLEGYSDFLHVLWSTLVLAITRAVGAPRHSVFFVGKAVSLLCAVGILLLVWRVLKRCHVGRASASTGLGTLALASPFALWSCSSLESMPFALIATGLVVALVLDRDGWTAIAAAALILERIDGFIYAGVLIGAFFITASGARRREMIWQIVLPVSVVFAAYHGWRWWYFKDLVPAPVEAKILYKFVPHQNILVKRPDRPYLLEFVDAYGWPAALAFAASAAHGLMTGGWTRRLVLAALPLAVYVSVVGDWMFGFRFFVPLLPIFSLILANSVDRMAAVRPRLAAGLCITALVYSAVVAGRFSGTYVRVEQTPSFLHSPSRDLHRFFWPYYGLYETARQMVFPGEVMAFNQAGFVPYMLDVNNIDDLGICSRFPADVPSTDIYFTEVGRYAPLTNKRTLRPVHAYFLYENVRFVMSRTDILVRANHDTLPQTLFGGWYELVETDPQGLNAIYRRSEHSPAQVTADLFTENVAHVSYVRAARIGNSVIDPRDYLHELPFLREGAGPVPFSDRTDMIIDFSDIAERVDEISIEDLRATRDVNVRLRLLTPQGQVAGETDILLTAQHGRAVSVAVAHAAANRLVLSVDARGTTGELWIDDLRLPGQRHALQQYVARRLHFPHAPDY